MNVFDLIIKQYNNEDMPKHIKINKLNYTYNNNRKTYESEYGEFMSFDFTNNVLNMQVELIEDEVDIDNIEEFNEDKARKEIFTYTGEEGKKSNLYCFSLFTERHIIPKINEVIRKVNKLEKEIKSIKDSNI